MVNSLFEHFEESGGCWASLKQWNWDAVDNIEYDEDGMPNFRVGRNIDAAYQFQCGSSGKNPLGLCPKHYKEITGREDKHTTPGTSTYRQDHTANEWFAQMYGMHG